MTLRYPRDSQFVLFLDPSAEHMAYCVAWLFKGSFMIMHCGMLYASSSWELGQRLHYMYHGLKLLIKEYKINHVVTEDFVMPKFRQSGVSVVPTINNNLKMLAFELALEGHPVTVQFESVATWRSTLKISGQPALDRKGQLIKTKSGKAKKDFKEPTKARVVELLNIKIPEAILANSNLKERATPHDITDCLAIAISYGMNLKYPIIQACPDLFKNDDIVKKLYVLRKKV